mgnify:CR=1 FL=1
MSKATQVKEIQTATYNFITATNKLNNELISSLNQQVVNDLHITEEDKKALNDAIKVATKLINGLKEVNISER